MSDTEMETPRLMGPEAVRSLLEMIVSHNCSNSCLTDAAMAMSDSFRLEVLLAVIDERIGLLTQLLSVSMVEDLLAGSTSPLEDLAALEHAMDEFTANIRAVRERTHESCEADVKMGEPTGLVGDPQ